MCARADGYTIFIEFSDGDRAAIHTLEWSELSQPQEISNSPGSAESSASLHKLTFNSIQETKNIFQLMRAPGFCLEFCCWKAC